MNTRFALYSRPRPSVASWYEVIDEAAGLGMTHIEGFTNWELAEPNPEAARKLRAYADKKSIRFCCLSCYCNFSLENTQAQLLRMKGFVDVAAILGSPYFHHTIVAGYPTPKPVLYNWDALFNNAISAIRILFDYAQKQNIRLIYENQGYMFNGVRNYGKFLDAVDRDVGVLLDMGNNYNVDEPLDAFLEAYRDRICHVHIKDVLYGSTPEGMPDSLQTLNGNYFWPVAAGCGIMPLERYITSLEKGGYTGFYSLEYGSPTDDSPLLDNSIETLRGYLSKN